MKMMSYMYVSFSGLCRNIKKTGTVYLPLLFLILVAWAGKVTAITCPVNGPIDADCSWTLSESPADLDSITVSAGVSATLEPGVILRTSTGDLDINGTLNINNGASIVAVSSQDISDIRVHPGGVLNMGASSISYTGSGRINVDVYGSANLSGALLDVSSFSTHPGSTCYIVNSNINAGRIGFYKGSNYTLAGGNVFKGNAEVAPDVSPVANGCGTGELVWSANTWTASCSDTSTDDNAVVKTAMIWGDLTSTTDTTAPFGPFSKTYTTSGIKRITHKAYDAKGQVGSETATVTCNYFSITGTVKLADGTAIPGAKVQARKVDSSFVKTVYTTTSGAFSATSLTPGEYRIYVSKYRFDFGSGAGLAHLEEQIGVGPSNSGNDYLGVYVAP